MPEGFLSTESGEARPIYGKMFVWSTIESKDVEGTSGVQSPLHILWSGRTSKVLGSTDNDIKENSISTSAYMHLFDIIQINRLYP